MNILGIETSCDETAAAIVNDNRDILANIVHSQIKEHQAYGGVVPEIASRSHISHIDHVINTALQKANMGIKELDGIAVTAGPGLIGGVIVGLMTAKAMASSANLPLLAINHLEGHALTARLTDNVVFPFLLLLVSGGHCQILAVHSVGNYTRLGTTIDDAVGEAFDKTAKMLGLGYPGGPAIEKLAKNGNPDAFDLPQPLTQEAGCNFSFSGLKTAVMRIIEAYREKPDTQDGQEFTADLCASFQRTCGDILVNRIGHAITHCQEHYPDIQQLVIAGGVAANQYLKIRLDALGTEHHYSVIAPPIKLCTDNAAMIAWAGVEHLQLGNTAPLTFQPKARWPLDQTA